MHKSVLIQFFPKLNTAFSASYAFNSGRPYYDPNLETNQFNTALLDFLEIDACFFPRLVNAGETIGALQPAVALPRSALNAGHRSRGEPGHANVRGARLMVAEDIAMQVLRVPDNGTTWGGFDPATSISTKSS